MKTCSVRLKRRDQYQSDNHETNDKTKPFIHNFLCMTMFFYLLITNVIILQTMKRDLVQLTLDDS